MNFAREKSVDAIHPVRVPHHRWVGSDVEFVKSVATVGGGGGNRSVRRRNWGPVGGPTVVDSYSCRQMYIRSYTFTTEAKKESVRRRTKRHLGRLKRRAVLLLLSRKRSSDHRRGGKMGCVMTATSAISSAFRRLMTYAASVEYGRRQAAP